MVLRLRQHNIGYTADGVEAMLVWLLFADGKLTVVVK